MLHNNSIEKVINVYFDVPAIEEGQSEADYDSFLTENVQLIEALFRAYSSRTYFNTLETYICHLNGSEKLIKLDKSCLRHLKKEWQSLSQQQSDNQLTLDNYNYIVFDDLIGVGTFGKVYASTKSVDRNGQIKRKEENKKRAVKVLLQSTLDEAQHESDMLKQAGTFHAKNLVTYECSPYDVYFIVTKFFPGYNLRDTLESPELVWTIDMKLQLIRGIKEDLKKIQEAGIAQLDFNPKNIQVQLDVDEQNKILQILSVKLLDFGFAQPFSNASCGFSSGNVPARAPEIFEGKPFSDKTDVYSFGILCWIILFGVKIFEKVQLVSEQDYYHAAVSNLMPSREALLQSVLVNHGDENSRLSNQFYLHVYSLLAEMHEYDQEARPSLDAVGTKFEALEIHWKTKNFTPSLECTPCASDRLTSANVVQSGLFARQINAPTDSFFLEHEGSSPLNDCDFTVVRA